MCAITIFCFFQKTYCAFSQENSTLFLYDNDNGGNKLSLFEKPKMNSHTPSDLKFSIENNTLKHTEKENETNDVKQNEITSFSLD